MRERDTLAGNELVGMMAAEALVSMPTEPEFVPGLMDAFFRVAPWRQYFLARAAAARAGGDV